MRTDAGAKKPRAADLFSLSWVPPLVLVPTSLLLLQLAFRYPAKTERFYGEWLYPLIATFLGRLNGLVPFSLAQGVVALSAIAGAGYFFLGKSSPRDHSRLAATFKAMAMVWMVLGVVGFWFVLSWGLNYARPSLEERLALPTERIQPEEVLEAGRKSARRATELHADLAQPPHEPTRLTLGFSDLNDVIDRRLSELRLPGDRLAAPTSPAKKLWGSTLLSYFGLSGIFIPFTGEPSINAMVPDASLPLVVAHERAHQRGITNEGEANLVAFMTCAGASNETYLSYAAYLYASARLLQASQRASSEDAEAIWVELGGGPRRDLEAIRDFWSRYQGPAAEAADRVNDLYLRSVRVPDGTRSYGRIVQLLIALDRQGEL